MVLNDLFSLQDLIMLMFYVCFMYIVFLQLLYICIGFFSVILFLEHTPIMFFWRYFFACVGEFRYWGIIALVIAYIWQLYTMWILIRLHESNPGLRYNRYVQLAQAAFGNHPTCSFFSIDETNISFLVVNFLFGLMGIVSFVNTFQATLFVV